MSKALLALFIIVSMGAWHDIAAQDNVTPKELVQYVRDARKAGLNEQQIQQSAVKAGWPSAAVGDAIALAATDSKTPDKNAAKDPSSAVAAKAPGGTAQTSTIPPSTPVMQTAAPAVQPANMMPAADGAPKNPATPPISHSPATMPGPTGVSGVPIPGVADSSIKPSQPVSRGAPDDYQIGAGDILHVNVWGEPTASVNGAVVRSDGKITLPLIHDISVLGMTPAQAEKAVADQLGRFINNADVAVIIGGINSKKIYVTGQVKKEGTIPYTYRMTVMQAISEAGGLTPYAKRKKIYVLRNEDGRDYKLPFDYDAVLRGEHMEMNIPLKPGDQLIVP
jgi:polysaccharide export outer membrane protein